MKAWRQHRCGSAIRIEQAPDQDLPNSSGSLAIFTAITEGTSLLMCPYGYFRASIIRFAIALFLRRQIFNCVSEFVWKPIGSRVSR